MNLDQILYPKHYQKPSVIQDLQNNKIPCNSKLNLSEQLKKEIIRIECRLKLMCYDFPKIEIDDIEYLRKFTLFLKIINKIIEKSFNNLDFSFSWEEIISIICP